MSSYIEIPILSVNSTSIGVGIENKPGSGGRPIGGWIGDDEVFGGNEAVLRQEGYFEAGKEVNIDEGVIKGGQSC